MPTYGSDTDANTLLPSLLGGISFPVPVVDLDDASLAQPAATGPLYAAIDTLTNADLTTGTVGGTGTFDVLMQGIDAHLAREYEAGRITGADYTKAYIALVQAALGNATQFLISKDQAYWQAVTAQLTAQTQQVALVAARVQLATAKAQLQLASYQAKNAEAEYALTKAKLATEDIQFGVAKYNLEYLLPAQLKMVSEQAEAQRAQTMDTRSDGVTAVTGVLGKQKLLYAQQTTSYQRDAEVKAAKIFSDAWITMKTIDEGLLPPSGFENTNLNAILTTLKTNNGL